MLAVLRSRRGLKVAAWHADRLTRDPGDTGELIGGRCRRGSPGGDTSRRVLGVVRGERAEAVPGTLRTAPRARSVTVVRGCWQRGRRLPQTVAGRAVRGGSGGSWARIPWTLAGRRCLRMTATRLRESCRCGRTRRTRLPGPTVTYPAAPRSAASRGPGTPGASSPRPGIRGADATPGGCSAGPGTRI
jgi:hypothetical protein